MNLCNDNHEEVCYEGRACPVCALRAEMKEDAEGYGKEIEKLEGQVSDLEEQLAEKGEQ